MLFIIQIITNDIIGAASKSEYRMKGAIIEYERSFSIHKLIKFFNKYSQYIS